MNRFSDVKVNAFITAICLLIFLLILFKNDIQSHGFGGLGQVSGKETWSKPAAMNWAEILHFIPDKKNEDCLQLFTTKSSSKIKDGSLPYKLYLDHVNKAIAVSNRLGVSATHLLAPSHEKLTLTYQELAKLPWVKTVCEIGFSQGQSALAWLTAKPDLFLHSFDIGTMDKTPYLAKHVKDKFKNRFDFHLGSSDMIMPVWAEKLNGQCDIISVDGSNEFKDVLYDLINMRKMAAPKHIIVVDDIEYPGVKKAWSMLRELGMVTEQYRCHIQGIDIDFVIGQYGEFFWAT